MPADPLKDEKPVASSLPGEVPGTEPAAPQGPEPTKELTQEEKSQQEFVAFMKALPKRLNDIEENQAKLVKILEANNSVSGQAPQQLGGQLGGLGNIDVNRVLDVVQRFMGGSEDPLAQIKMELGGKIVDGALDQAAKNIGRSLGKETAIHVTHG